MKFTRLLLLVPLAAFPQAHPWYQTDFPPEEFKARVENVFEKNRHACGGCAARRTANQRLHHAAPRQRFLLSLRHPASQCAARKREGKVLSADDTALMKQLTGVDEYRARRRYAATFFGRRAVPAVLTIYLYSVQRGRRQRTEPL